jgi:hypothetical protein
MTSTSLRAVTLKTVANYTRAAERAVAAYRASGHRLIGAMQRGVDRAAQQGAERLAPRLAAALCRASGNVTGLAAKGLDAVSSRSERAIEIGSTSMSQQVSRVANLAEGVDKGVVASGLQAAVRISLPGAQAALAISERVVAGAGKLPGAPVRPKPASKSAVAKAKRAGPASRRAGAARDAQVEAVLQTTTAHLKKAKKARAPVAAGVKADVRANVKTRVKPKAVRRPAAKPVTETGTVTQAPRARRAAKASPTAVVVEAALDTVAA